MHKGKAEVHYINNVGVNQVISLNFDMPNRKNNEDLRDYKNRVRDTIKSLLTDETLRDMTEIKWRGHSHYREGY